MKILALRNAIIATTKILEPTFKTVEPHGGTFDVDELRRIVTVTPAALLAFVSARPVENANGVVLATIQWALYIVATDDIINGVNVGRDPAGITLLNNVLEFLPFQKWGTPADLPKNVGASNLFSGRLDQQGAAIFQITWDQRIELDPKEDPNLLLPYEIQANTFALPGEVPAKAYDETELPQ